MVSSCKLISEIAGITIGTGAGAYLGLATGTGTMVLLALHISGSSATMASDLNFKGFIMLTPQNTGTTVLPNGATQPFLKTIEIASHPEGLPVHVEDVSFIRSDAIILHKITSLSSLSWLQLASAATGTLGGGYLGHKYLAPVLEEMCEFVAGKLPFGEEL